LLRIEDNFGRNFIIVMQRNNSFFSLYVGITWINGNVLNDVRILRGVSIEVCLWWNLLKSRVRILWWYPWGGSEIWIVMMGMISWLDMWLLKMVGRIFIDGIFTRKYAFGWWFWALGWWTFGISIHNCIWVKLSIRLYNNHYLLHFVNIYWRH
jgi:hypothetical protein